MFADVRNQRRLEQTLLFISLLVLSLIWLTPFATVVMSAIRSQGDLLSRGVFSWPKAIAWKNFSDAWNTGDFSIYFRNSLLLIFLKVPLGIFIAALAAYPLAKMRFRFSGAIFIFFLAGLAVPVQVTLQPLLVMMKQLGIANSIFALIPPYVAFGLPFQIFVLRGFFRLIPSELLEAARLDGASEWTAFLRVMVPLSVPALATLCIIDVLNTWNEFLIALVLISAKESRTVPVGLLQFQGEYSSQYTLLMAGILISIIPVIVIFIFLQRYFVAGLTSGAVKG
ncbi:carbohydrate ABC transporter permease [Kaistia geumhonensis]|uniref:Raffinose/stachyose/melibiose transport system permease protein n=1 Tax=Kaistia geumhonensis TaxID=410839 RepID=A0ABU0M5S0_9HYPH|nr:carbohydrate ABC transporter permease [Kaistia geumhonensis]MCX5478496.1 carbohydrate ABC transporter permease [Kaistia geumhonensis]MDQ0516286.1 raffinose/stachyose/melibiose transport system permease protein [Kaistia geumhonensis]